MRIFLFFLLMLCCAPVDTVAAYDRGAFQKNESAIGLLTQQKYVAALELLQQAAEEQPFNEVIQKNIATAYLGAGQKKLHDRKYSQAAEFLQKGKEYNDQESRLWLLRGIALLKGGQVGEAEGELNEAWAMTGDEPRVLQFLGQIYYDTDRMLESVGMWQRALALDPENKSLASLLAKAERELQVEKKLDRNYSGHFILSYAEDRKVDIGGATLDALEEAYTWAGAKLGHYPERQTPVILYTQRQFAGLTGSPEWAAGLYDGKIRLSIGGLLHITPQVKALLAHEFMHVMVMEVAGQRVPFWLNEGLAELAGRQQDNPPLIHLQTALRVDQLFSMSALEGAFRDISPQRVALAYEQSFSFVLYLIERFGWYQMAQLLENLNGGNTISAAIDQVYGEYAVDLIVLERDWRRQL